MLLFIPLIAALELEILRLVDYYFLRKYFQDFEYLCLLLERLSITNDESN